MRIPLSDIYIDSALQTRALAGPVDPALVEEYASEMKRGKQFPPIDVFMGDWIPAGKLYTPVDGFHRVGAALAVRQEIGVEDIDANPHVGTRQDALKFSIGANHAHGQRVTNADKRKKVNLLLDVPEWEALFDTVLAEWAGVSSMFVGNVRRERAAALNGLTVEEDAGRASEVVEASKESILAAAEFAVRPVIARTAPGYLFWDPESKPEPVSPFDLPPGDAGSASAPRGQAPHLNVDRLAAALGVKQDFHLLRIEEADAERIIEKLGHVNPGEFASKPNPHPSLDMLAAAFFPRHDWFMHIGEAEAERLMQRLGDLQPGELAPESSK